MKKQILSLFLTAAAFAQNDAARVLTGSAQPPLPFNILANPGFEDTTTAYSVTSGTFTTTSTFANVARGRKSASWVVPASVSGFIFQSRNTEIPAGLYSRSCVASMLYKGDGVANGALVIEAYDGTNALGTKALSNVSTYTLIRSEAFTCPASGSLRIRVRMSASCPTNCPSSPTAMYFDEMYLGDLESSGSAGGGQFDVATGVTVTNGGTVTMGSEIRKIIYLSGSGGAVTLDTTTPLSAGTTAGYERVLVGTSDTNTVTIAAQGNVKQNGEVTLGDGDTIYYEWDVGSSKWQELNRQER